MKTIELISEILLYTGTIVVMSIALCVAIQVRNPFRRR